MHNRPVRRSKIPRMIFRRFHCSEELGEVLSSHQLLKLLCLPQLCNGNEDDVNQWQRIGTDYENSCGLKLTAVQDFEQSDGPTFFDICIPQHKLALHVSNDRLPLRVSITARSSKLHGVSSLEECDLF